MNTDNELQKFIELTNKTDNFEKAFPITNSIQRNYNKWSKKQEPY